MTEVQDLLLDHLVIAAYTLEAGVDYIESTLGVRMQAGGVHTRMGSHNALLKLGQRQYLEVISPDPNMPSPKRPRWFDLDMLTPDSVPRLVTWVARTPNLKSVLHSSEEEIGQIEPMSRGDYRWLISIPPNGGLLFHGILPAFIEWQGESHPAEKLTDAGCKLIRLEAYHPDPERMLVVYKSMGIHEGVTVIPLTTDDQPYLIANIETPGGVKELSGRIT